MTSESPDRRVATLLLAHFETSEPHRLVTASRAFPVTSRVDLQNSLIDWIADACVVTHWSGVQNPYHFATLTLGALSLLHEDAPLVAPLAYEDVDIGESAPIRCIKTALWLGSIGGTPVALLLTPVFQHGQAEGWQVEMATLPGEGKTDPSQQLLGDLEGRLASASSYRGKVISLEQRDNYSGKVGSVRVHKLHSVARDEVILPEATVRLLERNVIEFIEQRDRLKDLGMGIKKGLLLHGPPGTGKTHTIHYLAGCLRDHTTLLITAEQVALLDAYIQLARFVQPAMIVLEDVDLIARERTSMRNPCEESLLNKLLNEMDGLREDAALLFVLTTNRPDELEAALAARPGRIDQAIEFPLPDEEGRRKLIRLYAGRLRWEEGTMSLLVRKTEGASAAFIKELMRRSAQAMLRSGEEVRLELAHVEDALDEMLFAGGRLNVKLLGGSGEERP